jgi:hypothetical protein
MKRGIGKEEVEGRIPSRLRKTGASYPQKGKGQFSHHGAGQLREHEVEEVAPPTFGHDEGSNQAPAPPLFIYTRQQICLPEVSVAPLGWAVTFCV